MEIRLGVVGTGTISVHHLQAIDWLNKNRNFQINVVAGVNRTEESNKRAQHSLHIPNVYTSVDDMLHSNKLDGILVLVPYHSVFQVTANLIPYKIPLLIEKPPGLNKKEAEQLSILSEECNTSIMVAFNRRFYSIVNKAKELTNSYGILGMRMDGFERYRDYRDNNIISTDKLESLMSTNTIHCIDLLRYYLGEFKTVQSFENACENEPFNHRYAAMLTSQDNIPATFQSYWHSLGNWCYELYLENGKISFANLEEAYVHIKGKEMVKLEPDPCDLECKSGMVNQMSYFISNVIPADYYTGKMSIHDAVNTVGLVDSIKGKNYR